MTRICLWTVQNDGRHPCLRSLCRDHDLDHDVDHEGRPGGEHIDGEGRSSIRGHRRSAADSARPGRRAGASTRIVGMSDPFSSGVASALRRQQLFAFGSARPYVFRHESESGPGIRNPLSFGPHRADPAELCNGRECSSIRAHRRYPWSTFWLRLRGGLCAESLRPMILLSMILLFLQLFPRSLPPHRDRSPPSRACPAGPATCSGIGTEASPEDRQRNWD